MMLSDKKDDYVNFVDYDKIDVEFKICMAW
jgi:hypothetical protein